MVGFICSVEPFENVFRSTDVRGVFSPMGANGAVMENHGRIYAALYQGIFIVISWGHIVCRNTGAGVYTKTC